MLVRRCLEKRGLEFQNQGIGGLAMGLAYEFVKHGPRIRARKCIGICELCQDKAPLETDHILPRCLSGEGPTQKICQGCHRLKNEDEPHAGVSLFSEMLCPFSSFFSSDILESLVKSRSPLSVIRNFTKTRPRQGAIFEFDVNRCRARILRGRDGWGLARL